MSIVKTYFISKSGETSLTPNFKVKEFRCKSGTDKTYIDYTLVCLLQLIRDNIGKPLIINSAYRTEEYNKKVGGAKNSYHIKGRAFDVSHANTNVEILRDYASTLKINGIIVYNTWVHIDTRDLQYHADYRNKCFVTNRKTINYPNKLSVLGSRNYLVTCIQYMLNKKGYNAGSEDGIFGRKTLNAVKSFQERQGLTKDGIVGKNTWNKLFNF